jgi:formate dehydrogenase subunit delta
MNIDLLIKMANEIGEFFATASDPEQAARDVAAHLRRYWEPRMRAQILDYYEERQGAGLTELAKSGIAVLHAAARPKPPGDSPSKGAPG